jgi:WD40 repeat protein
MVLAFVCLLAPTVDLPAQELLERATFKGHTFYVGRTALSPDGKILASGGGDTRGGELKLWDTSSGKEIGALPGYSNSLYALVFSSDGKRLASSGGTVQVWDIATRKQIAAFKEVDGWAQHMSFSRDGKLLGVVGYNHRWIWDVDTSQEKVAFSRRNLESHSMVFSPDLATLAAGNYQEIDICDVATDKVLATLSEHRGQVFNLSYSSDGTLLVAASYRYRDRQSTPHGDLKLWDVAQRKERITFKGPFGALQNPALSPDSKTLAVLDSPDRFAEPDLKILDVATGRQRLIRAARAHSFLSVAFTADGRLFVVGTPDDRTIMLSEVSLSEQQRGKAKGT